jgi:hypothetical protein
MAGRPKSEVPLWPLGLLALTTLLLFVSPLISIPRWLLIAVLVVGSFLAFAFRWYWMFKATDRSDVKQAAMRKRVIDGLKSKDD